MLREVMTPPQREPYEVEEAGLARDDPTAAESSRPVLVYRARGCAACNLSGYAGREGLYELMPLEPPVRKLIQAGAGTSAIREAALQIGMRTLRTAGLAKVRAGITSLDEVLRVTVNY
ncbi:MAG TPA: hypothetical protein VNO23_05215 [Candidatus Binatia bacterium]|nr:hypothetical protein [Candidatus Binatia bacterium]